MATITAIKEICRELGIPTDENKVYPCVKIWVQPNIECETSTGWQPANDGFVNEGGRKIQVNGRLRKGEGWAVTLLQIFDKDGGNELFAIGKIETQRGQEKIYKSLDTLVREFKGLFGERSGIQIQGL